MKNKMRILAILSLFIGIGYMLLPEIEVEARYWGLLSVLAGVTIFGLHARTEKNMIFKWFGAIGFGLLAIAQWFPIQAWTFSPMITDHVENYITLLFAENGHLGVIPHLILFSLSLYLTLSFLRDTLRKKWEVPSILLILALSMGAWSLIWLADFRNTFDDVMKDDNPQLMNINIDRLQYQMKEVAREVSEEGYWEVAEEGSWLNSKELGLRFYVPYTWLSGDPDEQDIFPKLTSFKNNVIEGEKWELQMQGPGLGMWPKITAWRDLYPMTESFLYGYNSENWDTAEMIYQAQMDGGYNDAELACNSFKSLVLASGDCIKVEELPMEVYQLDYAGIFVPEHFLSPEESEKVGGFIWFVSLESFNSPYGGFVLDYQMTGPLNDEGVFHEEGPDGVARDFFNLVLEIKENEDYKEFEKTVLQLLSSVEGF